MKSRLPVLTTAALLAAAAYAGHRGYLSKQDTAMKESGTAPATFVVPSSTDGGRTAGVQASERVPAKPTEGDQLLVRAKSQLERRASVTARLRHQVSAKGRHLKGVGGYWQQGSGEELRVRLELQVFSGETSLLQVSNGRYLWTDRRLPTGRSITGIDLRKLRNEATRANSDFDDMEPGQASWFPMPPALSIANGGLPSLLAALSEHFNFLPPQAMRWTPDSPREGLPETLAVFAVVGHWKEESLARIVPNLKDAGGAELAHRMSALPERLPQEVMLLFGQSDLFPYRVEFRKLLNPPAPPRGAGERTVPFQLCAEPLVLMELEAVSFDVPIAAGQFDYSTGDEEWDDQTAEYLDKIRRDRQEKLAARHRGDPQ